MQRKPVLYQASLEEIEATIKASIAQNETRLAELLEQSSHFTWEFLLIPLDEMEDQLQQAWAAIEHVKRIMDSEQVRVVYKSCAQAVNAYYAHLRQDKKFFDALLAISTGKEYSQSNEMQRNILNKQIQACRIAGAHLSEENKAYLNKLRDELSELNMAFMNNLNDATTGWSFYTDDVTLLQGLSDESKLLAAEKAKRAGKSGWILTIDTACYIEAMTFLENRDLRRVLYDTYVTRASNLGPAAGRWDNSSIMERILCVRHEIANVLGFANFAELSLVRKMAKGPEAVLKLLRDLISKAKPIADAEMHEVRVLAKSLDGLDVIEPWDVFFYSEKLKSQKFGFNSDALRPYFSVDVVLKGLFAIFNKLFSINIVEKACSEKWDASIKYYEVSNASGQLLGTFYADLYARANKESGPGFTYSLVQRKKLVDGSYQLPIAVVVCNLNPPTDNTSALLAFEEVKENIFHEFGHCLQLLLTSAEYVLASGLASIPWDVVEFPSNFLEYFVKQSDIVSFIGKSEAGEAIPVELVRKLMVSINFQSATCMLSYLGSALLDMRMHVEFDSAESGQIQSILDDIRKAISILPVPTYNRSQHSFKHAFAGTYNDAYAAGYYSYVWSDILATNALERFEKGSLLDRDTGAAFKKTILERSGWSDPENLCVEFCGHKAMLDAFLSHEGLPLSAVSISDKPALFSRTSSHADHCDVDDERLSMQYTR